MIGTFSLQELAQQLPGELSGGNAVFTAVSTDTRQLENGDLYLALQGENFDGNQFVEAAVNKGACAAIVSEKADDFKTVPLLKVVDTHNALGTIARQNRRKSKATVVALTGSQGKTSVKEMLAAIFAEAGATTATKANLNNTIGVPFTLLGINAEHDFAVVEMGANAPGEIQYCVQLAEPNIALITNATDAHLEGFGSAGGIVKAKGEIIQGLGDEGTLVLNADDKSFDIWKQRASQLGVSKITSFSLNDENESANAWVSHSKLDAKSGVEFTLHFRGLNQASGHQSSSADWEEVIEIQLSLLGQHNIANAVAAALVARVAGVSLQQIQLGLKAVKPIPGRMEAKHAWQESTVIDDSYNASPTSFQAAIDVLRESAGTRILMVGDMKELGSNSEQAQEDIGRYAAEQEIDLLWSIGEMSKLTSLSFVTHLKGTSEENSKRVRHFASHEDMAEAAKSAATKDVTFLIKGSRGARMDKVVTSLTPTGDAEC